MRWARLQLEKEREVFDARVQEAVHQLGLAEGLELVRDLVREVREHHGCQDVQARCGLAYDVGGGHLYC